MNGNTHPLGRDLVFRGDKDTTDIGKIIGVRQEFTEPSDAPFSVRTIYTLRLAGGMPFDVPAECIVGPTTNVERHLIEVGETISHDPFREAAGLRRLIGVLGTPDAARSIAANAEGVKGAMRVLLVEILRARLLAAGEGVSRAALLGGLDLDLDSELPF
jgi:hypothetical protein